MSTSLENAHIFTTTCLRKTYWIIKGGPGMILSGIGSRAFGQFVKETEGFRLEDWPIRENPVRIGGFHGSTYHECAYQAVVLLRDMLSGPWAEDRLTIHSTQVDVAKECERITLGHQGIAGRYDFDLDEAIALLRHEYRELLAEVLEPRVLEPRAQSKTVRRRSRNREVNRLTDKQKQALEAYANFEGNTTKAAESMGIDRKTYRQHLEAAKSKIGGEFAAKLSRPKTKCLPIDKRGQTTVQARPDSDPTADGGGGMLGGI